MSSPAYQGARRARRAPDNVLAVAAVLVLDLLRARKVGARVELAGRPRRSCSRAADVPSSGSRMWMPMASLGRAGSTSSGGGVALGTSLRPAA